MVKYTVGCYSPPSALKIEAGDKVKVEGWSQKLNIRAERIENIKQSGPICQCGTPKVIRFLPGLPEWVEKTGTVKKIVWRKESIEFELETGD